MSYEEVKTLALQLNEDERELLSTELSLSVQNGDSEIHCSPEWAAEINRRVAEVEAGTAELTSEAELLQSLRNRGFNIR